MRQPAVFLVHGQRLFGQLLLAARRATCGSRELQLRPVLFAWLAWWAHNAITGQAMQHWRQANTHAFLDIYTRVVGQDADVLEKTAARLNSGMEKTFFEENNAKSPEWKKIYADMRNFQRDQILWFRFAEARYDTFMSAQKI